MTRYLLDTNIWIYIMRNRPPEVRARFARGVTSSVVMSPVVLGELHVGWRKSERAEANRELLMRFTADATLEPIDAAVAASYGVIRAELERRGASIGENDIGIAAQAGELKCWRENSRHACATPSVAAGRGPAAVSCAAGPTRSALNARGRQRARAQAWRS